MLSCFLRQNAAQAFFLRATCMWVFLPHPSSIRAREGGVTAAVNWMNILHSWEQRFYRSSQNICHCSGFDLAALAVLWGKSHLFCSAFVQPLALQGFGLWQQLPATVTTEIINEQDCSQIQLNNISLASLWIFQCLCSVSTGQGNHLKLHELEMCLSHLCNWLSHQTSSATTDGITMLPLLHGKSEK